MHVLVTGGCGYTGTLLTEKLIRKGFFVTVVDAMWFGNYLSPHKNLKVVKEDIRNVEAISMKGVDAIIHLANIANDPSVELDPKISWEVNVLGSMQLVEKAINNKVKQLIYASSGSVYGVKDEPQVTEDLKLAPISVYNKTKMISERVLLSYQDSITLQCIRPATVCGYSPRMRFDLSVNMLTMQALTKGKITVFGGKQIRPHIHIKDIVDVYIHFLELGEKATGIYNAGFENMSIMKIAKKVTEFFPAEIVVTESNDPRSYHLNSNKLLNTGFKPSRNVQAAITEILDAFQPKKITEHCWT